MQTTLFVDGSYLFQILRLSGVSRLNFDLSGRLLAGEEADPVTYLYETYPWPREAEEPGAYWDRVDAKRRYLHAASQSRRIRIRVPEPIPDPVSRVLPMGYPPAPDVLMAVDLVRLLQRSRLQRVILVWADSAILPAVEHAREEGVIVQLRHGGPGIRPREQLLNAVDEAEVLTDAVLRRAAMGPANDR